MKHIIKRQFDVAMIPWFKALYVSLFFFIMGCISVYYWRNELDWNAAIPFSLFYTTLCINTFFSIRVFTKITPLSDITQWVVDIFLVILYTTLAWTFINSKYFLLVTFLLFVVATLKYVLLRKTNTYRNLLRKKITTDSIGTVGALIAFLGAFTPYPLFFIWLWTIGFIVVNIYVLLIDPLYTTDHDLITGVF